MLKSPVIERTDDILSGTPVFAGTRVPVQTLLDYLQAGQSLDEFLDDFPTVDRDQAKAVVERLEQAALPQEAAHDPGTVGGN